MDEGEGDVLPGLNAGENPIAAELSTYWSLSRGLGTLDRTPLQ